MEKLFDVVVVGAGACGALAATVDETGRQTHIMSVVGHETAL